MTSAQEGSPARARLAGPREAAAGTMPARARRVAPRRALLLLLAGAALLAAWRAGALGDAGAGAWVRAEVRDLVLIVEVEGTLASRDSSQLGPPLIPGVYDFKIAFMAPEGSRVERGEPVLGLDDSEMRRRLLQLQTDAEEAGKKIEKLDADVRQQLMELELQLAEARAALRKAELKADLPPELRSDNEARLAALDLELARREVDSLERRLDATRRAGQARRAALVAQKERAEKLVRDTEQAIREMVVRAPRDGTVIYVPGWQGEKKKVGDTIWRFEKAIELPDLSRMMARGEVDEADAGRIAEGQLVWLRLDAHPEIEYTGRIESVWRSVQPKRRSTNPLKVVRLDIALDRTDTERMRPGMRFRGRIEVGRVAGTLAVPITAVSLTRAGAVVVRRGTFASEVVPVRLGARDAEYVQVLSGLQPGDLVARRGTAR